MTFWWFDFWRQGFGSFQDIYLLASGVCSMELARFSCTTEPPRCKIIACDRWADHLAFAEFNCELYSKKAMFFPSMVRGKYSPLKDGETKVSEETQDERRDPSGNPPYHVLITLLVGLLTGLVGFWAGKSINSHDPTALLRKNPL